MHSRLVIVLALSLLWASPMAAQGEKVLSSLPVRKVVLYKSGLGFFEHAGEVNGNETVDIALPSRQLDDVLKSLTVIDRGRGQVSGVTYDSAEPLSRRFAELAVHPALNQGLLDFLNQIPGAEVEIRTAAAPVTGRLMGAEMRQKKSGEYILSQTVVVSLFTAQGEVRTMELPSPSVLRFTKPELAAEMRRFLELLDSSHRSDVHHLRIETAGAGPRPLLVSYTSEAPIWKTTYRIVLDEKQKPLLQGWAVVDNTTPNEWSKVELRLVAGSPVSFIQNISQPVYGQRPVIPMAEGNQVAPQTHQATLDSGSGPAAISGVIKDPQGGLIPNARIRVLNDQGALVKQATADSLGRYGADVPPGTYRVEADSTGFAKSVYRVTVQPGRTSAVDMTLNVGSVSETVEVRAEAATVNTNSSSVSRGRARVSAPPSPPAVSMSDVLRENPPEVAETAARGEQFEYKLPHPVTIKRNQSALLPIVHTEVEGEKVSLYNESMAERRPRLAVWLKNSSGLTLPAGSFTVLDADAFAGEGLLEVIHPEERRLLSYALDTALEVKTSRGGEPVRVQRVEIVRGLMKMTNRLEDKKTYVIHNSDQKPRVALIEHPVRNGWTLVDTAQPAESSAGYLRFRVETKPKSTTEFVVRETNPQSVTYELRNTNAEQIEIWVRQKTVDPEMERALRSIVTKKNEIAEISQKSDNLEQEVEGIDKDQARMRENLSKLGGSKEEAGLRERYVRQMTQQEDRLTAIRAERTRLEEAQAAAEKQLQDYLQGLAFDRRL